MQLFLRRKKVVPGALPQPSWLPELKRRAEVAGDGELILDLSDVEKISSKELGELAKIHLQLRQRDCKLVVENAEEYVVDVFEITRMNRLVEVRHADHPAIARV